MESLAIMVGLICNFKAGRDAKSQDEFNEFVEWLIKHNHRKVIEEFDSNAQLSLSIKALLNQNHGELTNNLDSVNASLTEICKKIDGFKEVTQALPSSRISDQCRSIMVQLVESGGSSFLERIYIGGQDYPIGEVSAKIVPIEVKFMTEDLNKLVELGFLRVQYIQNNSRLFHLTREGQHWVENGL